MDIKQLWKIGPIKNHWQANLSKIIQKILVLDLPIMRGKKL